LLLPLLLAAALAVAADDDPSEVGEEVMVESPRLVDAPCRIALDRDAVRAFPARSPEELLRVMPGMRMVSRLGFGGAYLYGYRGMDAGHGRDLAVSLGGVPLNQPAHLLDPGYLSLAFVPMTLVSGMDLCPAAVRPEVGGFGTALSADLRLGLEREGFSFAVGGGSDGSGEISLGWRPRGWSSGTWVVAELDGGEGVGKNRSWRHLRLSAGVEGTTGPVSGQAMLLLHDGLNDVPTPVRADDLESGETNLYGGYGLFSSELATRRMLLSGRVSRPWPWGGVTGALWFGATGFRLRDNLTGAYHDPTTGDGTERRQPHFVVGLNSSVRRVFSWLRDETRLEAGVDLRANFLRQRVRAVGLGGEALPDSTDQRVEHNSLAAWARVHLGLGGLAEISPSVRVEQFDIGHLDLLDPTQTDFHRAAAFVAAPRATLVVRPWPKLQLHSAFSRGYRPPDGRLISYPGRLLVTRVDTVEGGFDLTVPYVVRIAATGFAAWSAAERLVDPLDGRTLAVADTLRRGLEATVAVHPHPALIAQVDVAWTDARDRHRDTPLPYVPTWVVTGSLATHRIPIGPITLTSGLRVTTLGRHFLPAGFQSRSSVATDLTATLQWNRWFFRLDVDNLVPLRRWDAESYYPSMWSTDPNPDRSALPERHILPGEPFALRLSFGATF
jgi:outer membrane receptor protein involved in Fe transport